MVKFGVIGAGNISKKFLYTLNALKITPYAIGSRDYKKALSYQKEYNIKKAYGSYHDLVADPLVDAVYIATPHSLHFEHIKLALKHNKHVFCEKPLTLNLQEANIVYDMAERNNLVLMEALKTRFLPAVIALKKLLNNNIIGAISRVDLSFSTTERVERLYNNHLGGGALMDIGPYPLHFIDYLFGGLIYQKSNVRLKNNVDLQNTLYLASDSIDIIIRLSMTEPLKKDAYIYGEKGSIIVPHFSSAQTLYIYDQKGNLTETLDYRHDINDFAYQIQSFIKTIYSESKINETMSPNVTSKIIKLMDLIRADWNLTYPNDLSIDNLKT